MSYHTHGKSGTPEYQTWVDMRSRCANKNHPNFKHYGGRGITVCARWASFVNFFLDMGKRPSASHSIDRYPNNNGNYEPENCRWATQSQQCNNMRTTVRLPGGITRRELAMASGINYETIRRRHAMNLPLLTPVNGHIKLSPDIAKEIRKEVAEADGEIGLVSRLAATYGVRRSTISNIVAKRLYKNA